MQNDVSIVYHHWIPSICYFALYPEENNNFALFMLFHCQVGLNVWSIKKGNETPTDVSFGIYGFIILFFLK